MAVNQCSSRCRTWSRDPSAAAVEPAVNAAATAQGQRELPIELVHRNPDQPRRHFDEAELDKAFAEYSHRERRFGRVPTQ